MSPVKRKSLGLQYRFGLAFSLMGALALVASAAIIYFSLKGYLFQNVRAHLRDIASVAAQGLDGAAHAKIAKPEDEKTDTYLKLKKALQAIRGGASNIRFVYTVRETPEGKVVFVVDAEEKEDLLSHPGDVYEATSPLLKNVKILTAPVVEDQYYSDQWGYVSFGLRAGARSRRPDRRHPGHRYVPGGRPGRHALVLKDHHPDLHRADDTRDPWSACCWASGGRGPSSA